MIPTDNATLPRSATAVRSPLVRWVPCLAMTLLSFISLMDRSILGILSPSILRDLHLTAEQYGQAILAFSICYMAANPIWGWLLDRVGLSAAILAAVALWSVASGAHAGLSGLLGLCMARGVLGFGEGAAFPAGLKTVTETLPKEKRSFGLGLAYSGGSLGALLTPLAVVPLAGWWGWRATFALSALAGFLWIGLWTLLRATGVYRKPAEPGRNAATTTRAPVAAPSRGRWNRDLFATSLIYGLGAAPVAYGLYAAPLYLTRVMHLPQAALGGLLWVPPAGWEAGYMLWGWVADRQRRQSGRVNALGLFALFAAGGMALCLIPLCARLPVGWTMALFFVAMLCTGGYVVIALAAGAQKQAAENTGFLAGFSISGWSLTTGVLMWQVGRMFDRGQFAATFWLAAALPWVGVLLWRALRTAEENPVAA